MSKTLIVSSGNTIAPALTVLLELGFVVTACPDDSLLLQAENAQYRLLAEDMLQLLGLASLALHRGENWAPTEAEISALLNLENVSDA